MSQIQQLWYIWLALRWVIKALFPWGQAPLSCHNFSSPSDSLQKLWKKHLINLTLFHWQVKSSEWSPAKDTFFSYTKKSNSRIREYIKSGKWMNNFKISTSWKVQEMSRLIANYCVVYLWTNYSIFKTCTYTPFAFWWHVTNRAQVTHHLAGNFRKKQSFTSDV